MGAVIAYFRDSFEELKRVTWSTRDEIIQATETVIVFVIMMTLLMWVLDVLFRSFFSKVL